MSDKTTLVPCPECGEPSYSQGHKIDDDGKLVCNRMPNTSWDIESLEIQAEEYLERIEEF